MEKGCNARIGGRMNKKRIFNLLAATVLLSIVFVAPAFAFSVVYQNGLNGYSGTQDAFIRYNTHANYGTRTTNYFIDGVTNTGADKDTSILTSFDISSIPDNMHIVSATLSMYKVYDSVDPLASVYKITSGDWSEGTKNGATEVGSVDWFDRIHGSAAWSTPGLGAGTDYDATALDEVNIAAIGWYDWDITSAVQDWYMYGDNYGVVFKAFGQAYNGSGVNMTQVFASSEYNSGKEYLRPKLTVIYAAAPEPATMLMFGMGLAGLVTRLRKKK